MTPRTRPHLLVGMMTLALLLGSGVGCASAMKKAGKLLESGNYDEAIAAYEKILREDPKEVEALEGLRSARRGFLDSRLLAARFSRLSGRVLDGAETLLLVSRKQAEWALPLNSAALTSWEEETEAQSVALHSEMRRALQENHLVRAEWVAKHFSPLFTRKGTAAVRALRAEVSIQGRKLCAETQGKVRAGYPYHAEYAGKLCRLWGQTVAADKTPVAVGLSDDLKNYFSRLNTQQEFWSAESAPVEKIRQQVQKGFQESPWFEPSSPNALDVKVAGTWRQDVTKRSESRVHEYQESEPYTAYESVKHADGTVTRQSVTKYRDVAKKYEYWGTAFDERFDFDLGVSASIPLSASHSSSHQNSGFYHSEWKPKMHLSPISPSLTSPEGWFQQQLDVWAGRWANELRAQWRARYCRAPNSAADVDPSVAAANQVFRCLRDREATTEAFVRSWHDTELAITPEQASEVLL